MSNEIYRGYASDIRKEYLHIPQQEFNKKRAKVLEHFIANNELLYRTSVFQAM